jgi:hypothetical protein
MYKSNQQRLNSYVAERRIEEANADEHQSRLYEKIAEELGQEVQATALAKMAKRVVNKFGEEIQKPSLQMQTTGKPHTAIDYLRQAISEGKLSQVFDMIKSMSTDGLSKKEKIIVRDIKNNTDLKTALNDATFETLAKNMAIEETTNELVKHIIDLAAGGDKAAIEHIVAKATRDRSNTAKTEELSSPDASPVITAKKKGRKPNPKGAKLLEVGGKPTKQGELVSQLGIN